MKFAVKVTQSIPQIKTYLLHASHASTHPFNYIVQSYKNARHKKTANNQTEI